MPSKPKVVTMIPTPFYNFTCSPSCQGAPTQPATPPRSTGGRPRQPASLIACVLPNLISSLTKQLGLPPPLDLLSFLGGPTHTNQSAIPGLHPDCAGESLSRSGFSFTRDSMAPAGIGLMNSLATVPQGTNCLGTTSPRKCSMLGSGLVGRTNNEWGEGENRVCAVPVEFLLSDQLVDSFCSARQRARPTSSKFLVLYPPASMAQVVGTLFAVRISPIFADCAA